MRVAPDMAELWRCVELDVQLQVVSGAPTVLAWSGPQRLQVAGWLRPQQLYRARRCTGCKGTAVIPAGDHPGLYQQLGGSWVRDGLKILTRLAGD